MLTVLVVTATSWPANAQLRITEFMADNATGLVDDDGEVSDWIEIHNDSKLEHSLQGWTLTDSANAPRKWAFPDMRLGADAYLVVFASGKQGKETDRSLHTNFKLEKDGEYIGLTSPTGTVFTFTKSKYPKQRSDVSYGIPKGKRGEADRDPSADYLAFPTPGRSNAMIRIGELTTIELSQPHGLFKHPFALSMRAIESDVAVRYTTDGSRPHESSPVFRGPLEITQTTVVRAAAYKAGYAPTPTISRSYIFPADRIDDSADGLPPENYPYDWGAGRSNYGMDANITRVPKYRAKLLDALWAIPSYSLLIENDNLFSDETGIYAHAGWHGRKAERACSLELLPTADGRETGFQIEAGVRMRGGSSRQPKNPKHAFRMFFRKQYGQAKLEYDLFAGAGAKAFDNFDLRCTQQYSWHYGFSPRALFIRDQFSRDLHLAMGHPAPRGNFRHLYINGHYWGMFNTCERPEASFGQSYIGGKKSHFDVVKIMGGYSEDDDQERRYQVAATDGNMQLWRQLNRLSLRDLSNLDNYRQLLGVKTDGSPDPATKCLIDPANLIDYMLVVFYAGNLDTSVSWFGNNRGANNWHGMINRKNSQGFQFIIWDSEHTLLDLIEDRLGPFPMSQEAERGNPTWLYQRLLESNEFRVLLADHISKHLFRNGVLTPPRLTK
ncbi:MAG: CotH kinase family protein, partial [Planctomycetaceae bacterium]